MQQFVLYNCWPHDQNPPLIIQKHVLNSTDFDARSFWQWILYCHRKISCGHSLLWGWCCRKLSVDSLSQEMDRAKRKFFYNTIKAQCRLKCQPQWPRGVSHMSVAICLLGLWVRNPPEAWMSLTCECRGLSYREVSASGRSLVSKSPTGCGVSECDREALITRRSLPTSGCHTMGGDKDSTDCINQ